MNLKTNSFYKEAASSRAVPVCMNRAQEPPDTKEAPKEEQKEDTPLDPKEMH